MHRTRAAWTGEERSTLAADKRAAFAALADLHLAAAYRLAGVILADPFDAEDATHDAVVTAWRRYGSLRDPARFEPWFQRILVNICRDRLRGRRRRPSVEVGLAPGPAGGDEAYGRVDDRLALDRAFEALSPDHRLAVVLRFYADLTVDEIADRTGVPAGTVKSRLHVATKRLHHALSDEREGSS
jgi:RNA polymerase sigma-70 factor, ECF subfamily